MEAAVNGFVSHRWSVPPGDLHVRLEPLHGGLESTVMRARIDLRSPSAGVPERLVVKALRAGLEREADVYEWLWRSFPQPPAVRLVGRQSIGARLHLYLEEADTWLAWPWADTSLAVAVCRLLARFHDSAAGARPACAWNYEAELADSAERTLQFAASARDAAGRRPWRRLGDLRRVVRALPEIRSWLLSQETTIIHGDVHPNNVCRSAAPASSRLVLIDWGRSRTGSPFEDVASWLQSLGCWEPQARRRHDTLLRAYLDWRSGAPDGRSRRRRAGRTGWPPPAMACLERSATFLRWPAIRPAPITCSTTPAARCDPGSERSDGPRPSSEPVRLIEREHRDRCRPVPRDLRRGQRCGAIERPERCGAPAHGPHHL